MRKRNGAGAGVPMSEVCAVLERIAPLRLAQSWDNVGLLAGDHRAAVRRVLLCIDLTHAVVQEAVARRVELVVAYHPPIFRPITRMLGHSGGTDAHVFRCVAAGIAVYSPHTALDAAEGGTNDVLAGLCGARETQPIEYESGGSPQCKVVVFVPQEAADRVAAAMFEAGAGHIGDYERCSFRLAGEGTFCGSESTNPTIGQAGRFERVAELRIECVAPQAALPAVVRAIRGSHPYEEPAFDIYLLTAEPVGGIGRVGQLPRPTTLGALAKRLRRAAPATCVQLVGEAARSVRRVVVCVGAAGSLPFKLPLRPDDAIVTGEIRHHDGLTIQRLGCTAIALGHWASERPVLAALAARLAQALPQIKAEVADHDRDPFAPV